MVSKKQAKVLADVQTLLASEKWAEARELINNSSDFSELGMAKIFTGIETDDEAMVTDGINKSLKSLKKPGGIEPRSTALYNLGNAFHYKAQKFYLKNKTYFGAEKEVRAFIKQFNDSLKLASDERAHVNLGNSLDEVGRPLEALVEYEKAIKINPKFGMAIANKAQLLEQLSSISSYQTGYLIYAYQLYEQALEQKSSIISVGGQWAYDRFQQQRDAIQSYFDSSDHATLLAKDLSHDKFSEKDMSAEELLYTKFCLDRDLYLNLHVFGKHSTGSIGDTISTSFITSIKDDEADKWVKETFMRLNEIKESYITGRYILWLSQQKNDSMSAISKQSLLVNNLDYTAHNIYTGLLKSSYKEAFSTLDKIANTLNFYLKLGHDENSVNYRNIWFKDLKKTGGFSDIIKEQNYMLFGLFSVIEELGAKPAGVRNALEHRYQRISTLGIDKYGAPTFDDFTEQTEHVYYKIKCAIVYLLNFINATESQKRSKLTKDGGILPTMPVHTDQWLDIW